MNPIVSCRPCPEYDADKIIPLLEEIYSQTQGPLLEGKTVLLKPNILFDEAPNKAVTTHPVFIEAVIRFLQSQKVSKIFVGDAPAMHTASFVPRKSGIWDVCQKTGAEWVFFGKKSVTCSLPSGKVPVTSIVHEVDYFFSLPKLKTHELMGFTGAIKNSFGLIPHLHKARQHAFRRSAAVMASFFIDLNEAILPDYIFMDGIVAMEGPGPGNGHPYPLNLILGSTNPLALDIIATKIIGYHPLEIETNHEGLKRKKWLTSMEEVVVQGIHIEQHIKSDFKIIRKVSLWKMSFGIVMRRIPFLRRLERRPVFAENRCIGCKACVEICPVGALFIHPKNRKKVVISNKKCIHCFCCHEVCPNSAIEIK
ncbi:MAG: DUF362 domain-containing protein [Prevotellaceae bacterium]|jgi:uncharacterized protein (DUF362 family)/ferredoxin|nr:DUF362 domain-containing protein [Prevotellaceae bacterium]